jgi:Secretion system C-terminal sorting domain
MKHKLFLFAFLIFNFANSQISLYSTITTSKPECLAFDNSNNLYILDDYYTKIIKLNSSLVQSNVTADFSLSGTSQMSYNPSDNCLYLGVSTFGAGKINKVTTSGVITPLTDPSNSTPVMGVVCDATGNIFYSSNNGKIYKRTIAGVISEIASNVYGLNLALDNSGNLIVSSNFYEGIYRVNIVTGTKTLIASTANIFIRRIAVNTINNDIYFTNADGNIVYKIANGATNYTSYLTSLALGSNGLAIKNNYLYVTENENRKIFKSTNFLKNESFEKIIATVYPNPSKDYISVKSEAINIEKIDIFDSNGKLISTHNKDFEKINIENLSEGFYSLKINDKITANKIIKK